MHAYDESYLNEILETQGKHFEEVQDYVPNIDMENFVYEYMNSKTRKYVDSAQAYVCTLDAKNLWNYFCTVDSFNPISGKSILGFAINWIGQFYAYFQWFYNISSQKVLELVPLDFIRMAYNGLHDLELDLAVQKVGEQLGLQ